MQAPDWFPMAQTLSALYTEEPGLCNIAFHTLLSTLCALLVFIGAPALDLLLGSDPKTPDQVDCTLWVSGETMDASAQEAISVEAVA